MKFADKGEVDETLVRIIRGNVREARPVDRRHLRARHMQPRSAIAA